MDQPQAVDCYAGTDLKKCITVTEQIERNHTNYFNSFNIVTFKAKMKKKTSGTEYVSN